MGEERRVTAKVGDNGERRTRRTREKTARNDRPRWVEALVDTGLTYVERVVLAYLAWRQGKNDSAWPSQATMAAELGLTENGVRRIARRLEAKGRLTIEKPAGQGRGQHLRYTVKGNHPVTLSEAEGLLTGEPLREKRVTSGASKGLPAGETNTKENTTVVSADEIHFDNTTGRWVGVSDRRGADWTEAYPGIDVGRELLKSAIWWRDNPQKRRKDVARFLTNWMARAERGFTTSPATAKPKREPQRGDFDWEPTLEQFEEIEQHCREEVPA